MGKGNQEYYEDPCEHVVHMECTKHNFVQVATFDRRAKLARFVSRAYLRCPGDGIAHELLVSFNEALDRNCTPKQLQSLVDHFPKPGRVVHSETNYETVECRLHQPGQWSTPGAILSNEVSTDSPPGAVYELYRVSYCTPEQVMQDENEQYPTLPGSGLPPHQVSVPETSRNAALTTTATHSDQYTRGHDSRVSQLPSQSNDLPARSQSQHQLYTWDEAERMFNQIVQGGKKPLPNAPLSRAASFNSSIQHTPDAFYPTQNALSDPSASDVTSSGPPSHSGSRRSTGSSHAPSTRGLPRDDRDSRSGLGRKDYSRGRG